MSNNNGSLLVGLTMLAVGGLGLFIYSDKDGIRFQTNPSKTFDAVFSMSSGQLSALIISFTLASIILI